MSVINGDLLSIGGERYIVLEVLSYNNKYYAFVNKISDAEEITEDFYVMEIINDEVMIVEDDNLRNLLIPKFEELLKKDIQEIINE